MSPSPTPIPARVALDPGRLQNLRWSFAGKYDFARDRLTVPLIHTELLRAARDYPIAMAPTEDGRWHPVAYLADAAGVRNRFVDENGRWHASYVPFWLRVYPFVREAGSYAVAFDPTFVGVGGEHAFETSGALSEAVADVVRQLGRAETGREALESACSALVAEGVARPLAEGSQTGALAFVSPERPAEIIGARMSEWLALRAIAVEIAVAAAFSSAFMPRATPGSLTLDPPRAIEAARPSALAPLYVPAAAPADLDWLDMEEKMLF